MNGVGIVSYDYLANTDRGPATLGELDLRVEEDGGYLKRRSIYGRIVYTVPRLGKITLRGESPEGPAQKLTISPRGFPFVRPVERNHKLLKAILEADGIKLVRAEK